MLFWFLFSNPFVCVVAALVSFSTTAHVHGWHEKSLICIQICSFSVPVFGFALWPEWSVKSCFSAPGVGIIDIASEWEKAAVAYQRPFYHFFQCE